jgi:hypothetical protein
MTDAAQEQLVQSSPTQTARPALEIVRNDVVTTEATADATAASTAAGEPNFGRSAMIGAVIGFFAAMIAVTVVGTLGGMDPGSAFGMGCFVGFWSGGGFGFMAGGTIPFARHLDALHAARSTVHGQGDSPQ